MNKKTILTTLLVLVLAVANAQAFQILNDGTSTTAVTNITQQYNFWVKGETQNVIFYIQSDRTITFNNNIGYYSDTFSIQNTSRLWDEGGSVDVKYHEPGTHTITYGYNKTDGTPLNKTSFTVTVTGNSSTVEGVEYVDWKVEFCERHPERCDNGQIKTETENTTTTQNTTVSVENNTLPSTNLSVNTTPAPTQTETLPETIPPQDNPPPAEPTIEPTIINQTTPNITPQPPTQEKGNVEGNIMIVLEIIGGLLLFVIGIVVIIIYRWKNSKDI